MKSFVDFSWGRKDTPEVSRGDTYCGSCLFRETLFVPIGSEMKSLDFNFCLDLSPIIDKIYICMKKKCISFLFYFCGSQNGPNT